MKYQIPNMVAVSLLGTMSTLSFDHDITPSTTTINKLSLEQHIYGHNFFNDSIWEFFTGDDPTHGFVNYTDYHYALKQKLIHTNDNDVYIGADYHNISTSQGRNSVRITSKNTYETGLFIISLSHMPYGCGTWPAFWMFGPDWPYHGEIDIIEGVHNQKRVLSALHTSEGCNMHDTINNFTGVYGKGLYNNDVKNCFVNATDQYWNQGCGISSNDDMSYGRNFNKNGGGVFATHIDKEKGIRIWFFNMNDIPDDITNETPNPDLWGIPYAAWSFGPWCHSSRFKKLSLVINLTFCGDWAGATWDHQCKVYGDTCVEVVKRHPYYFKDAYWKINYIKIFQ